MLGVSRSGVSTAASALHRAGVISYMRGRISILNRRKLEGAACECYQVISEELGSYLNS